MNKLTAQSAYSLHTYIIMGYKDGCAIFRTRLLWVSSKLKTLPAYMGMLKIGDTPHYKLDLEFNCTKKDTAYIFTMSKVKNNHRKFSLT